MSEVTVDIPGDAPLWFQPVIAALLVASIGYVAVRSLIAHRRGDDVGRATARAVRAVAPPLVLAVLGLVLLSIVAAVGGVLLFILLIALITGNEETAGNLIILWLLGIGALLATVVGALVWGLVRVFRNRREGPRG